VVVWDSLMWDLRLLLCGIVWCEIHGSSCMWQCCEVLVVFDSLMWDSRLLLVAVWYGIWVCCIQQSVVRFEVVACDSLIWGLRFLHATVCCEIWGCCMWQSDVRFGVVVACNSLVWDFSILLHVTVWCEIWGAMIQVEDILSLCHKNSYLRNKKN
jgi:hypothetical protein